MPSTSIKIIDIVANRVFSYLVISVSVVIFLLADLPGLYLQEYKYNFRPNRI